MTLDLDLYADNNPKSLLHLLKEAEAMVGAIRSLPEHLIGAPERELRRGYKPDTMMERLKIAFWDEYRAAIRAERNMIVGNIVYGLCGKPYFYDKVVRNREALAWLIAPPPEELMVQRQLLQLGYKRLHEVLKLPFVDVTYRSMNGKNKVIKTVNVSLIKEVRTVVQMLEDRIHGSVVHKQQIESKSLNLNLTPESQQAEPKMEDIDKMLRKLEQAKKIAKGLPAGPETIEGEVEE